MATKQLTAVILACLLTFPPSAFSGQAEGARVLLLASGAEGDISLQLLEDELARSSVASMVIHPNSAESTFAADGTAQARNRLNESKKLYKAVELDRALQVLESASRSADISTMREIYLFRALIQSTQKQANAARESLESYIAIGGSAPDDGYYAPEFIRLHQSAKRNLVMRPRTTIIIYPQAADPSVVSVSLDGRNMGKGALSIQKVLVGQHFLRLEAPGHSPYQSLIQVQNGGASLSPTLQPLSNSEIALTVSQLPSIPTHSPEIAVLQRNTLTQGVLVVRSEEIAFLKGGKKIWSRPLSSAQPINTSRDGQTIAELVLGERKPSEISKPAVFAQTPTASRGSSWYQKWWVWTLVGAAAAAGGGAAVMMGSGGSDTSSTVNLSVRPQ